MSLNTIWDFYLSLRLSGPAAYIYIWASPLTPLTSCSTLKGYRAISLESLFPQFLPPHQSMFIYFQVNLAHTVGCFRFKKLKTRGLFFFAIGNTCWDRDIYILKTDLTGLQ